MTGICQKITIAASSAALSLLTIAAGSAQAITFELDWTGQEGYSAQGSFSYDETQGYNIVTQAQLDSFTVAFFDPFGNQLANYIDNHLSYEFFNFNFDTTTKTVQQTGGANTSTGVDLGLFPGGFRLFSASHGDPHLHLSIIDEDGTSGGLDVLFDENGLVANKVPEPATVSALTIFGLAALLMKKKRTFSIKK